MSQTAPAGPGRTGSSDLVWNLSAPTQRQKIYTVQIIAHLSGNHCNPWQSRLRCYSHCNPFSGHAKLIRFSVWMMGFSARAGAVLVIALQTFLFWGIFLCTWQFEVAEVQSFMHQSGFSHSWIGISFICWKLILSIKLWWNFKSDDLDM